MKIEEVSIETHEGVGRGLVVSVRRWAKTQT